MHIWFQLIITFVLIRPSLAQSSGCLDQLRAFAREAISGPIDRNMRDIVDRHPISNLAKTLKGGEGIHFYLTAAGQYIPFGDKDLLDKSLATGETIQAEFVRSTLVHVFPNAIIGSYRDYRSEVAPKPKKVVFEVRDIYEKYKTSSQIEKDTVLPMHLLKAANSRAITARLTKKTIKKGLGLESRYVVHLIGDTPVSDLLNAMVWPSSRELAIAKKAQGIARSSAKHPLRDLEKKDIAIIHTPRGVNDNEVEILFPEKEIVTRMLTDGNPKNDPNSPLVLVNTTRGLMPLLHRASDLVVVNGQFNVYEGVNNGTPTIAINPAGSGNLSGEAYKWHARIAQATNGVAYIDSINELGSARLGLMGQTITPSSLVYYGDRLVFERYLDELYMNTRVSLGMF